MHSAACWAVSKAPSAPRWGWVLGGSASAGTGEIAGDLASIETTLNTIEAELGPGGPIVTQLKKLQCATDSDWITAGPATAIDSWYATYSNFLTLLSDGSPVPVGEISSTNTDIDTLYGWANGVIQGDPGVAPTNVLTSMIELNNLSTQSSSAGTIADCIQAAGNQPATGSVDDRVYYSENVQPIQDYLLGLNTQAMIVLTEAYHIYAYGDCLTANGGDDAACSSSASTDVAPNLCPSRGKPLAGLPAAAGHLRPGGRPGDLRAIDALPLRAVRCRRGSPEHG